MKPDAMIGTVLTVVALSLITILVFWSRRRIERMKRRLDQDSADTERE